MKFFSKRTVLLALTFAVILLVGAVVASAVYLKSPAFEARARRYIVEEIERRTGGKVTLKDFDWSFWQRRIRIVSARKPSRS